MSLLTTTFVTLALAGAPQDPGDPVPATLQIEVVSWADGKPLANAKIAVHWGLEFIRTADAMGSRPGQSVRAQSDAVGRATVEVPHNEQLLIYVAPTESTRLARAVIEDILGSGGKQSLRIEAYPDLIPVRGRVVDDQGRGVAGARVQALWGSEIWMSQNKATYAETIKGRDAPPPAMATADAEGNFRFEGLASKMFIGRWHADWMITASAEGLAERQRLRLVPREVGPVVEGLELRLAPTREVRGTVIAEDGSAVEGAEVSVSQFGDWAWPPTHVPGVYSTYPGPLVDGPFLTDAEGRYVVPGVVHGNWTMRIQFPNGGRSHFVKFGETDELADLSLVREGEDRRLDIVGQVVDTAGRPIEGARIEYRSWRVVADPTDAEGRFILPNFLPENLGWDLKCYAPGYAVAGVRLPKKRKDFKPVRFVLEPELTISGRALNRDGTPCVGRRVLLSPIEPEGANWPYWKRNNPQSDFKLSKIEIGADGRFHFPALWAGKFKIRLAADSFGPFTLLGFQVVESGKQNIELRVGDGMTSVRGRLVDSETGLPIREFSVRPVENGQNHHSLELAIENDRGEFEFPALAQGSWSFYFEAKGYRSESSATFTLSAENDPLEFSLGKKARLRVRVTDATGRPVPTAILDCIGINGDILGVQTIEPLGATEEDGHAELAGLPKGRITLLVWPMQSFASFQFPVDLRESRGEVFEVKLPADFTTPRQQVNLRFEREDGSAPERSFQVIARDENDVIVAAWRTSYWEDFYAITPGHDLASFFKDIPRSKECTMPLELPVGRFRLAISGEGFEMEGPEIEVKEGQGAQERTVVLAFE